MKNAIVPIILLLVASCSIKEDRSSCPANVYLKLSGKSLEIAGGYSVLVRFSGSGVVGTVKLDSSKPGSWEKVTRGDIRVEAMLLNGAGADVAWGGESDSLWACTSSLRLREDQAEIDIELHKRFATLNFFFDKGIETEKYAIVLRSDIMGTDLTKMMPIPGDYLCPLYIKNGRASVRVPAQCDNSSLVLYFSNSFTGEPYWTWDLAASLEEKRYDWNAADLGDIDIQVTAVPAGICVEVGNWMDCQNTLNSFL